MVCSKYLFSHGSALVQNHSSHSTFSDSFRPSNLPSYRIPRRSCGRPERPLFADGIPVDETTIQLAIRVNAVVRKKTNPLQNQLTWISVSGRGFSLPT